MPIFDEGPRCGERPIDSADIASINNAAKYVCKVIVAPIFQPPGYPPESRDQAVDLAARGAFGGKVFDTTDAEPVLTAKLLDLFRAACPKDCNGNGMLDSCDLATERSFDCFPARSNCCWAHAGGGCTDSAVQNCVCLPPPQGSRGLSQCCSQGWTQECADVAAIAPCNATCSGSPDGIPDECQPSPDCNANGVEDADDIACAGTCNTLPLLLRPRGSCTGVPGRGTVPDCNRNCVPDSCDIALCGPDPVRYEVKDPRCDDCNANGVPDECDMRYGTSCDANGDLVPDECAACCTTLPSGFPGCLNKTLGGCQALSPPGVSYAAQGFTCGDDCVCVSSQCCCCGASQCGNPSTPQCDCIELTGCSILHSCQIDFGGDEAEGGPVGAADHAFELRFRPA